jgi:Tol biopolymer transport system component
LRNYNRPQIFTINLADNLTTNLSDNIWRDTQPAWSPDGRRIAFITPRKGPYQIWTMAADGSDQQLFSRSGSLKALHPRWSPDGQVIAFSQSNALGGIPRLMVARYNYEGDQYTESQIITGAGPMREPAYSPDGVWVAFEGWPEGANHDIFIMTTNGLFRQQLTTDGVSTEKVALDFDPVWRPVGDNP